MFSWIKNVWGIPWMKSKVNIIEQEPMKSTKFLIHLIYIQNNGYDGLALAYQN